MLGQSKTPAFEVASVKRMTSQADRYQGVSMRGGPGSSDPSQIAYNNVDLATILKIAYDAHPFQIVTPAWLASETYEIKAKVPLRTTKNQFRLMLENLIAERFHLVLHHELRDVSGYKLVGGKNGSKLKKSLVADSNNGISCTRSA